MLRAAVFYSASILALSLFGCEVCPFIHSLGRQTLAVLLTCFFAAAFLVRIPLEKLLVDRQSPFDRPRRQLELELGLFVGVGLALTVFDHLVYGFPVASGLRATAGCVTIGLFAGIDGALARERKVFSELSGAAVVAIPTRYSLSFSRKFMGLAIAVLALLAADLYLLAAQDPQVLPREDSPDEREAANRFPASAIHCRPR